MEVKKIVLVRLAVFCGFLDYSERGLIEVLFRRTDGLTLWLGLCLFHGLSVAWGGDVFKTDFPQTEPLPTREPSPRDVGLRVARPIVSRDEIFALSIPVTYS